MKELNCTKCGDKFTIAFGYPQYMDLCATCERKMTEAKNFENKTNTCPHDTAKEPCNETCTRCKCAYEQGRRDEAERWMNQSANEHDAQIRKDERRFMLEELYDRIDEKFNYGNETP